MTPEIVFAVVGAFLALGAAVYTANLQRAAEARAEEARQAAAQALGRVRAMAEPDRITPESVAEAVGVAGAEADQWIGLYRLVRDDLSRLQAETDADLKSLRSAIEAKEAQKPLVERYLLPFVLALIAITPATADFFIDEEPNCAGYSTALLAVHAQSPTNDAAVEAAEALTWGDLEIKCGPPGAFIRPLGEPPPPG